MNLCRLSELFNIHYPKTAIASQQIQGKIPFISASGKHNGISLRVEKNKDLKLYPAGSITVPLKGTVLHAFLQNEDFYCAHQIAVLVPKKALLDIEKLFYCMCIRHNKHKYNYGRQADNTLKDLLLPTNIPEWVYKVKINNIPKLKTPKLALDTDNWKSFDFNELFMISRGKAKTLGLYVDGETPVVSASSINNGVSKYVNASDVDTIYQPQLTISNNGAVLDTFYQAVPFIATSDVYVVNLRDAVLTENIGLFLKPIIELLKVKYSYGRKASLSRINNETIKLPVTPEGTPDWAFMEEYMNQIKGI